MGFIPLGFCSKQPLFCIHLLNFQSHLTWGLKTICPEAYISNLSASFFFFFSLKAWIFQVSNYLEIFTFPFFDLSFCAPFNSSHLMVRECFSFGLFAAFPLLLFTRWCPSAILLFLGQRKHRDSNWHLPFKRLFVPFLWPQVENPKDFLWDLESHSFS